MARKFEPNDTVELELHTHHLTGMPFTLCVDVLYNSLEDVGKSILAEVWNRACDEEINNVSRGERVI